MISTHENRSYSVKRVPAGDKFRSDFVLTCAGCGTEGQIHMDPQCAPDIIVKKFQQIGWLANERNPKGCYCPECLKRPAKKAAAEPARPMAELPKGPTHEQRKRIAEHLRGIFDDERGCYTSGETDQSVGQALSVPWAWIRECRELLGFEIRTDAEIEAFRAELAAMADMIIALEQKLNASIAKRIAA